MPGQIELAKERLRDPTAAIVRTKLVVRHNQHLAVRLLDAHSAGRREDSEVGDSCLWRATEPLRHLLFKSSVDGVKLTVFRASTGPDETIANSVDLELHQCLLDLSLLKGIDRLLRHIHRRHTNPRIQSLYQGVFELRLAVQFHELL